MQKIIATIAIIVSLFLVGCTSETHLRDMEIIKLKVRSLELTIDDIKSFSKPGGNSPECVYYTKCGDSHAISSVTIPITSWYYINAYGKEPSVKYLISGQVINGVIDLVRDTCPNYEKIKGSIK